MSTPKPPPPRLPESSVAQWRNLRSKLNDLLTRVLIATLAVGGLVIGDASSHGTKALEETAAIVGALFVVAIIAVLLSFRRRFSRLYETGAPDDEIPSRPQ